MDQIDAEKFVRLHDRNTIELLIVGRIAELKASLEQMRASNAWTLWPKQQFVELHRYRTDQLEYHESLLERFRLSDV